LNADYYHFHYQSYCKIVGIGSEISNIFDRSNANTLKSTDSTDFRYRLIGTSLISYGIIVWGTVAQKYLREEELNSN